MDVLKGNLIIKLLWLGFMIDNNTVDGINKAVGGQLPGYITFSRLSIAPWNLYICNRAYTITCINIYK